MNTPLSRIYVASIVTLTGLKTYYTFYHKLFTLKPLLKYKFYYSGLLLIYDGS